ncbi:helicase POLQ-like isoform X2 [Branchiostoma lanceolatum]|uniref:helicase POLQ-like isoform X2 n=1 Tax=Branchiostoma lanceolatum TaxID=7740 RepID=UPI00345420DA
MAGDRERASSGRRGSDMVKNLISSAQALGADTLDLTRRQLTSIPDELFRLQDLEYIYLEGNYLSEIPDYFFTYLPNLKWLDLRRNRLKHLPSTVGSHRCLRTLLLEGNELTSLPLELGQVMTLKGLNLRDNPLHVPPPDVMEQGTLAILQHLREAMEARKREDAMAKGVLIEQLTLNDSDSSIQSEDGNQSSEPELRDLDSDKVLPSRESSVSKAGLARHMQMGPTPMPAALHKPASYSELRQQQYDKFRRAGLLGEAKKGRQKKRSTSPLMIDLLDAKRAEERRLAALRELKEKQALIEQRRKDQQLLKDWRDKGKRMQMRQFLSSVKKDHKPIKTPYGVDSAHMKMVDRKERMLGEGGSRGATLEMCLAKVLYISKSTQIIGMSATLNNIQELQTFLSAEVYSNNFRPVQLKEYLKITDSIFEVNSKALCPDQQIQFSRMVSYKYPKEMQSRDPDHLVGMVMDVIPAHSCLLFCPTKKNCQNVVDMLCKLLPRTLREHKVPGKKALLKALESDGNGTVCPVLKYTIPFGLAYHHSGLTMDERRLVEEAYSEGVLCLLACTSTLAAGVNLPAKRVILRAPFVGEHFISRAQYKQMVGRAGRAGIDSSGESVTIVKPQDKAKIVELIGRPFESCRSSLMYDDGKGLRTLILNLIGLKIATSRAAMSAFLSHTLFSVQCDSQQDQGFMEFTQQALQDLIEVGLVTEKQLLPADNGDEGMLLEVTRLGQASFKGPIDIKYSNQLYQDLCKAQEALVVENSLHMLYLVTPYDMVGNVRPNWMIYFRQLSQLKPIELKAAAIIGVPEGYIARKASGQRARKASVEEAVVSRFYLTLMIYSLMKQHSIWDVSEKFEVPRGFLQNLLSSAASFCACVMHFCEALEEMWPLRVLLESLVKSLSFCVTSELIPLMEVPGVKQGRARQLYKAGYKTLQDLAHAETETLVQNIQHMPRKVAYQIIAAAKVLISEKAESLLEEAEDLVAMPTDGVAGSVAVETDAMSVDGWSQDSQDLRWSQVSLKETPSQ